ncbi:MAG: ABC transporter permease [Gemmatimonadales bacterium]|nr:ABC transporter permease [Gemmatimonadales bacterium]
MASRHADDGSAIDLGTSPARKRTPVEEFGIVEKPLSRWEKLYDNDFARKLFIVAILIVAWESYARVLDNELLFPTFSATVAALGSSVLERGLAGKAWSSIQVLLVGYVCGLALAVLLTVFAITTRIGRDFLATVTAMFNPLPAIALLPLALLWFGLGSESLVFVLIHSVLWAVALNTLAGFQAVSTTLRMVGRNYGLKGLRYVFGILVPAAFPAILAGLKIGWAFAWRTLIAAELVFGVSSGRGGLGWFIYENKNQLEIPNVFAGLLTVILIGFFVENVVFRNIERRTVQKWGMQE